jgi:hypothetical protein
MPTKQLLCSVDLFSLLHAWFSPLVYVTSLKKMRNSYKILFGKPEGKRPLRRPRRKWKDNTKVLGKQGGKMWTGCIWLRMGEEPV